MSARTPAGTSRAEIQHRLEHELGRLVRRVRRVIHERARAIHPDLQPASYLLLAYLAKAGPARSSAVVDELGIDKGAVSRQVQNLADLGLLERSPDPADRRATQLSVTDDARRRLRELADERRTHLAERLGDWSDADLAAFVDGLARYNAALD